MKKWLSYLFPISIKTLESPVNGRLEINWVNGKKVLDTAHSNYSYGTLQQILKKGLKAIRFEPKTNEILVLGMGVGSILETLRKDFHSKARVDLVELDSLIIHLAQTEFGIDQYQPFKIFEEDAFAYLQTSKKSYELIVVDLFIGNEVPLKFCSPEFILLLNEHLVLGGKIIFNTMAETMPKPMLNELQGAFLALNLSSHIIAGVAYSNNLLIIEKG
ncbi:MAG: fused MFS/spermidine synthase [bacterium]|nr:fused MFS/spermidine synthase [bacterium]